MLEQKANDPLVGTVVEVINDVPQEARCESRLRWVGVDEAVNVGLGGEGVGVGARLPGGDAYYGLDAGGEGRRGGQDERGQMAEALKLHPGVIVVIG